MRKRDFPSCTEICAVSRISKKEIGRCFKLILKALETSVDLITTGDFMSRFCSNLGLPKQVQMAATFIARKAVELDLVPGRSPISVAAAAIYMASQASAEKKTQKGESFGCCACGRTFVTLNYFKTVSPRSPSRGLDLITFNTVRCFHRNRGHCRRCRRHHQTVVPSHLPTGCRTLSPGLQVRHARGQAAAAVKTLSTAKSFPAVMGLLFFILFLLGIQISLWFLFEPLSRHPQEKKHTFHCSNSSANWTYSICLYILKCIYMSKWECVIGCYFRLVSYTVYRTFLL